MSAQQAQPAPTLPTADGSKASARSRHLRGAVVVGLVLTAAALRAAAFFFPIEVAQPFALRIGVGLLLAVSMGLASPGVMRVVAVNVGSVILAALVLEIYWPQGRGRDPSAAFFPLDLEATEPTAGAQTLSLLAEAPVEPFSPWPGAVDLPRTAAPPCATPAAGYQRCGELYAHSPTGVSIKPSTIGREIFVLDGKVEFDATYTITAGGYRVSRPLPSEAEFLPDAKAALFLGCSYVFGVGVQDDETLPSRFLREGRGRWLAYNLGIGGGGIHTVVSSLEGAWVQAVDPATVGLVVYAAIPDHVRRAVGLSGSWSAAFPRYDVSGARPVLAGVFGDAARDSSLPAWLPPSFAASSLLSGAFRLAWQPTPAERRHAARTWLELVRYASELVRQRFGLPLVVLLWPSNESDALAAALRGLDVVVVRPARGLLPYPSTQIPGDTHPTPQAHAIMAQALLVTLREANVIE